MNDKKKSRSIIKRGLLLLFPWRDALGFVIASFPIRLGELWSIFLSWYLLPFGSRKRISFKRKEIGIALILIANFTLASLCVLFNINVVDNSFANKYLIRNVWNILFIVGFLASPLLFSAKQLDRLFKYFVIVELASFLFLYVTGGTFYLGSFKPNSAILATGQYVLLLGFKIPRFMGTCSEAGYLAPLLSFLMFYFLESYFGKSAECKSKKARPYIIILICLTLLTFSAAVIFFVLAVSVFSILKNVNNIKIVRIVGIVLVFLIVFSILMTRMSDISTFLYNSIVDKVVYYISGGDAARVASYSAADRTQHLQNAWEIFTNGNVFQMLFGRGTGAYSYQIQHSYATAMGIDAEEAYNIFLSTLTDRGIAGFCLLIAIIPFCKKHVIKGDIFSQTLFCAILAQYAHWMITGNMWLYYFWYEIVLLLGYERYKFTLHTESNIDRSQIGALLLDKAQGGKEVSS